MNTAPILLFVYKRLDTLKQAVSALQKNYMASASDLFIFSDAAKKKADMQLVNEVREYLRTIEGFKSIKIIARENNLGLAKSIISGTSQVLSTYDRVIILEDDLITTPNFLSFMNTALDKYEREKRVFSISGYSFKLKPANSNYEDDAYFLNRGWSWGWATWKDRWDDIDWEVKTYSAFAKDRKQRSAFAAGGSDLNKMLREQIDGKIDSWAIRWFYHQFLTGGLTLYPVYSKVNNAGFDEFATHTTGSQKRYVPELDKDQKNIYKLPEQITITTYFQHLFSKKMGIRARIQSKIQTILLKIFKTASD
jgi:hypothetical protein